MTAEERFSNTTTQLVLASGFFVIALIGVAGLIKGRLDGILFLAAGSYFFVRSLNCSSVIVGDEGVRTRSIWRDHFYKAPELVRVDVSIGPIAFVPSSREFLVFRLAEGKNIAFRELTCRRPRSASERSVVRSAADSINRRLSA